MDLPPGATATCSSPVITIGSLLKLPILRPPAFPPSRSAPNLPGRSAVLEGCLHHLKAVLSPPSMPVGPLPPCGVLVEGGPGAGTSSVASTTCAWFGNRSNVLSHTTWVDCAALRHQKLATVKKRLRAAWQDAACHAPAIIVFDDLDALVPKPEEGPTVGSPADQQAWLIAEELDDIMTQQRRKMVDDWERASAMMSSSPEMQPGVTALVHHFLSRAAVMAIGTVASRSSIQQQLCRDGLFSKVVDASGLSVDDRAAILRSISLTDGHGTDDATNWVELATLCDGYSVADLRAVVARARHQTNIRTGSGGSELSSDDFQAALDGYTPAFLRNIKLFKSDVAWEDVGGLYLAKSTLKETLEFPVKFAPLYSRSPLRMPSGVLLYGPPGCGKTMASPRGLHCS